MGHRHHRDRCDREAAEGQGQRSRGVFSFFWQMMGHHHHHGGRGGGRHGDGMGFPGGFGGGEDWSRGRKFSGDDLQLLLLALLEDQPSHGYELIKALQTRSNGYYCPSPGMVYPALTYLEELGYVTVELEGNRKRYALSDAGRSHLDLQRERVRMMLDKLSHIAERMKLVKRAFAGEEIVDGGDSGWTPELIRARAAIKRALQLREDASPEEQRRIAAILDRARREIEEGEERKR